MLQIIALVYVWATIFGYYFYCNFIKEFSEDFLSHEPCGINLWSLEDRSRQTTPHSMRYSADIFRPKSLPKCINVNVEINICIKSKNLPNTSSLLQYHIFKDHWSIPLICAVFIYAYSRATIINLPIITDHYWLLPMYFWRECWF
jgi:hypothetical protein